MPDIGTYHPQVVHFAIVLCIVGVVFRLISLTGRAAWTNSAALTLILVGTLMTVVAVQSGTDAHGPIERIPGAREAVQDHEDWGKRTRNIFLVVALLEIAAAVLAKRGIGKGLRIVSALAGLGGCAALYETGEHGGILVYSFAGGPGIRSGDTTDVTRLLISGLYQRGLADRAAGRLTDAARLFDELAARMPNDRYTQLLLAESTLKDRKDPATAMTQIRAIQADASDARMAIRKGMLLGEAYVAAGFPDSARAVLTQLKADIPRAARMVDPALEKLK
ncbi:MAG: DUF2231 domain-containing protein [Gemmatimonadota bacterium]